MGIETKPCEAHGVEATIYTCDICKGLIGTSDWACGCPEIAKATYGNCSQCGRLVCGNCYRIHDRSGSGLVHEIYCIECKAEEPVQQEEVNQSVEYPKGGCNWKPCEAHGIEGNIAECEICGCFIGTNQHCGCPDFMVVQHAVCDQCGRWCCDQHFRSHSIGQYGFRKLCVDCGGNEDKYPIVYKKQLKNFRLSEDGRIVHKSQLKRKRWSNPNPNGDR
jgi:hypothetical protein